MMAMQQQQPMWASQKPAAPTNNYTPMGRPPMPTGGAAPSGGSFFDRMRGAQAQPPQQGAPAMARPMPAKPGYEQRVGTPTPMPPPTNMNMGRGFPGGPPIQGDRIAGAQPFDNAYNAIMQNPDPRFGAGERAGAIDKMRDRMYGRPAPPMRAPQQWGGRPPQVQQPYNPRTQMNWQQQQMQGMPRQMRQAYNNRPMDMQSRPMRTEPLPTQRGRPVASRANLQGNQLNRFRN